jgi:hypothetical protein
MFLSTKCHSSQSLGQKAGLTTDRTTTEISNRDATGQQDYVSHRQNFHSQTEQASQQNISPSTNN